MCFGLVQLSMREYLDNGVEVVEVAEVTVAVVIVTEVMVPVVDDMVDVIDVAVAEVEVAVKVVMVLKRWPFVRQTAFVRLQFPPASVSGIGSVCRSQRWRVG
jgi:hypothetical protein